MRAAILMTTYNGEKFLKQQIESIIHQTYKDWELFICDDGSVDTTMHILNEYKKKETRIKEIFINDSDCHGAYLNYFFLMRKVKDKYKTEKYDYYFYCDQDDIWIPEKMQMEIEIIEQWRKKKENQTPCLVYSDLELIDEKGKKMHKKMSDIKELELENPFNIFFCPAYVWGTTMAHNQALWDLLIIPDNIPDITSHDNYVGFYAVTFGIIHYIDKPLVLYRRHLTNTSPMQRKYNLFTALERGIRCYKMIIESHSRDIWNILYFIENAPYKTEKVEALQCAVQRGGIFALKYIKQQKISSYPNIYNKIALKWILLFKLYKHSDCFKKYNYGKNRGKTI